MEKFSKTKFWFYGTENDIFGAIYHSICWYLPQVLSKSDPKNTFIPILASKIFFLNSFSKLSFRQNIKIDKKWTVSLTFLVSATHRLHQYVRCPEAIVPLGGSLSPPSDFCLSTPLDGTNKQHRHWQHRCGGTTAQSEQNISEAPRGCMRGDWLWIDQNLFATKAVFGQILASKTVFGQNLALKSDLAKTINTIGYFLLQLPLRLGNCTRQFARFYFDTAKGHCFKFIYTYVLCGTKHSL